MNLGALKLPWGKRPPSQIVWSGDGDDVIALHRPDGRFLRVSEGASSLFGCSAAALSGKRLMDVVVAADQPVLLAALARVSRPDGPGRARFDCQLRHGDDERAHAEIALARLPDGNIRSVTRPIEHRLTRERQYIEQKERALDLAARRNDHLANISHEIRTPLNAVIGFADALYREHFGSLGTERNRDYARAIHESGVHLQSLITDLLDLEKAEANEMTVEPEAVDPADLVRFCVDVMQLQAQQAGLYLECDLGPAIGEVMLDVKIVRQILLNTISNALKFTNEGGITIKLRHTDDQVTIAVVDTGVGMSPDDLAKVGHRFKQVHREGVRGAKGTGIGLSLSKALARAHGGELSLVSQSGKGTTALLRVPFVAAPNRDWQSAPLGDNVTRLADVKRA
ncbi:MAG: sensor histidine kinase [Parvularcula sp.]